MCQLARSPVTKSQKCYLLSERISLVVHKSYIQIALFREVVLSTIIYVSKDEFVPSRQQQALGYDLTTLSLKLLRVFYL